MKLSELLAVVEEQVALVPGDGKLELTAAEAINLFKLKQNAKALVDTVRYIKNSVAEMQQASVTYQFKSKELRAALAKQPLDTVEVGKKLDETCDMVEFVSAVASLHEGVYEVKP